MSFQSQNDPSPSLAHFITQVEAARAALDVALQEARLVQHELDVGSIDRLEQTLYDQIDSYNQFGNFQIDLNFDRIRDEVA